MLIKQDPVTGLFAREDGAVLMPPSGGRFKKFRWTFGCKAANGYLHVRYKGKFHSIHRIVCRAFHGLPPADKPFCDHKSRIKSENFANNLRWVSAEENQTNSDRTDRALVRHGVRSCEDRKGYNKSYYVAHREERRAHNAAHIAKKKAQGLTYRKDSTGKWGWYPKNNPTNQNKE